MFRGSITIAVIAGIPIRVHWTFGLLLVWYFIEGLRGGGSVARGLANAGFVAAIFLCVTLHELGHALAARGFGIRTRSITLLPIGGVAALERIPEKPLQELVIAVAGPAVNVVIAAAIITGLAIQGALTSFRSLDHPGALVEHFLAGIALVNVSLLLFNMIPAFPMDGGRVLRALLSIPLGFLRATIVAARVGQVVAAIMGIVGIFFQPMLILIALFVWMGAAMELQVARMRAAQSNLWPDRTSYQSGEIPRI